MAPSHYLNQFWNIVNSTLRNKLQWNFNQNLYIFIQENALENVVWKMGGILSLPQCAKTRRHIYASVKCVITGSGNGLSPALRQAITWTNLWSLLSLLRGTNVSKIWIKTQSLKKKRICKHFLQNGHYFVLAEMCYILLRGNNKDERLFIQQYDAC